MFAILAIVALAVRLINITSMPLWLDEIYGYQLALGGFRTIINNSLVDPHPPLFYLLQWASTGFGLLSGELAWRWLSVVSGVGTVLLTYQFAQRHVHEKAAFLGSLLFALSPFHVIYSQESRSSALLTLIAIVSLLALHQLTKKSDKWQNWLWFGVISLAGLYTGYNYVLVIAIQIVYLLLRYELWYKTLFLSLLLLLGSIPLLYFFLQAMPAIAQQHSEQATVLWEYVQSIVGGDMVRYGFFWWHPWIVVVFGVLVLPGLQDRWRKPETFLLYPWLQLFLPFILFWAVFVHMVGIRLPLSEAKQFIVVLPAFFILVCQGIDKWTQMHHKRLGYGIILLLCGFIFYTNFSYLDRYWEQGKSPEGHAVLALREQAHPEDAIVSLHHSPTFALSFYMPDTSAYISPRLEEDQYVFIYTGGFSLTPGNQEIVQNKVSVTEVWQHQNIWVLVHEGYLSPGTELFFRHCDIIREDAFSPFVLVLVQDCVTSQ
jgi:mannosyltransferase